jgi:ubiquinone/menaquinone biosynthesis C-methylase UbiE
MDKKSADIYRCPHSQAKLTLRADEVQGDEVIRGRLVCEEGHSFEIERGIADLIVPKQLGASDAEFQEKYDRGAVQYEAGLEWLFKSFYEEQVTVRARMVDLLNLKPSMRVLEVGCGTGKDSGIIAERLSSSGQFFLSELSPGMLEICRRMRASFRVPSEFLLANASYLPFPDGYFDAVFHFGGINTFSELKRAFDEITRVSRKGATVVVGDEGVSPWLREKAFGKILINANPLYKHQVPLEHLPESARNVQVQWILGNAFYVISYQIGDGPPAVDLDLPIPGKGDSLRSRYEARRLPVK